MEACATNTDPQRKALAKALGRLTVEVRTRSGKPSDALKLASWFTDTPASPDGEKVMSDLVTGGVFNDLEVVAWKTPQELRERLLEQFVKHLGLTDANDINGFNVALGFKEGRWPDQANPDEIENFQILSPVRQHPHGVRELNRWLQSHFRAREQKNVREFFAPALGDERISGGDKVIQLENGARKGYDWSTREQAEMYLANGDIGAVNIGKSNFLNVCFAGRPNMTFGYTTKESSENFCPLELAYALTVHKAQGSQFGKVFVVLPKQTRLLSRELLYTALTRARDCLVLLVEGDDLSMLHALSSPEKAEAVRRNTNIFSGILRALPGSPPYAEHLIHKTDKGHLVRSKSELIISNLIHDGGRGPRYDYESALDGTARPGRIFPDFSFVDAGGDRLIWEHLGRMDDPGYVSGWEWKRKWYEDNGFILGQTLFVTEEHHGQGLDMAKLRQVLETIKAQLA